MRQYVSSDHPRAAGGTAGLRQTSTRRVKDLLRSEVRSGLAGRDAQFVEDYLVQALAASRTAVREALQMLAQEGLVSRERRNGTTVTRGVAQFPLDDILESGGERVTVQRLDQRSVPSTPLLRARLATQDETLGVVEHLFSTVDGPIGVRVAYYKLAYTQPEGWAECPDLRLAFHSVFGRPLDRIDSVIEAGVSEPKTSRLLGIPEGSPVLIREQLLVDDEGVPQEFTFAHYRADRVSFSSSTSAAYGSSPRPSSAVTTRSSAQRVERIELSE
ncbi:GntR family transcriptional regulator [Kineococcus rhizosphaerae]|nr:GntR family transcriptional regulator [Kineococcus rhizosphaerae]